MITEKVKDAILDLLKADVDKKNRGILAEYKAKPSSFLTVQNNGVYIDYDGNMVYQYGKPVFVIVRTWSKKLKNGDYPQLTPKLQVVK